MVQHGFYVRRHLPVLPGLLNFFTEIFIRACLSESKRRGRCRLAPCIDMSSASVLCGHTHPSLPRGANVKILANQGKLIEIECQYGINRRPAFQLTEKAKWSSIFSLKENIKFA
jgi:hypothetical protein